MVKELEVKILNIDPDYIEKKIQSLGGKLISKEQQINTLIDSNNRPIKSYLDAYLRIRQTKDLLSNIETTTLTLKKNIENKNLRENIELNTNVEDKDTMLLILQELGFDKTSVGYKERTSYRLEGARLDLDVWDKDTYPNPYIEIEVDSVDTLENIIEILEIPKENISKKSIVELRQDLHLE